MRPRQVLHLTVSTEGLLAVWDDRERALLGKKRSDVYCPIVLSLLQTRRLRAAQKEAADVANVTARKKR